MTAARRRAMGRNSRGSRTVVALTFRAHPRLHFAAGPTFVSVEPACGQRPADAPAPAPRSGRCRLVRVRLHRHVPYHGAGTAQLTLAAGVLDEIELHVIPMLIGRGRRLFEALLPS